MNTKTKPPTRFGILLTTAIATVVVGINLICYGYTTPRVGSLPTLLGSVLALVGLRLIALWCTDRNDDETDSEPADLS